MAATHRIFLALGLFLAASSVTVLLLARAGIGGIEIDSPAVDDALIERGRYLSLAGNCGTCHTSADGEYMAGGLPFETPFGTIYSTNITPDHAAGIGDWTLGEFAASMRHGVGADGRHLYPVFPYTAFTKLTDDDIAALFAYLGNVPAVNATPPANDVSFPFNIRALMSVWKTLFFDPGPYRADPDKSDEWNRGAYLVEAAAHCGACHSPRNALGAVQHDRAMAGGLYTSRVRSGQYRPWSATNLTGSMSGLGLWPHGEVAAYLGTGRNEFVETFGPMNDVIINSTRHLSDQDIQAMATYLKSIPAIDNDESAIPDARVLGYGRTVYNLHCGSCHLPTGLGDPEMAPRIGGGSLVVRAEDPASLINVILYGPEPPEPPLPPKWREPMAEYQFVLDDEEIAAVATFIRHSWDNGAGPVTPDQVARQR